MRKDNVEMLQDTLRILRQGSYKINGKTVNIKLSKAAMEKVHVLLPKNVQDICSRTDFKRVCVNGRCGYGCVNMDSFAAARQQYEKYSYMFFNAVQPVSFRMIHRWRFLRLMVFWSRIALMHYPYTKIREIDREGAEIAEITHKHSLGYMPAAVLVHIISRIVYPEKQQSLKEIVMEARDTVADIYSDDSYLKKLTQIIDLSVGLSENGESDLDNIHRVGEGWVAEETLGIAVYCALRHKDDFSAGVTAAVNHGGDSDSTGAVTGNILGALLGYEAIEEKWKKNLELADVILEMADDLCHGCQMSEYSHYEDPDWIRKYMNMCWKESEAEGLSGAYMINRILQDGGK